MVLFLNGARLYGASVTSGQTVWNNGGGACNCKMPNPSAALHTGKAHGKYGQTVIYQGNRMIYFDCELGLEVSMESVGLYVAAASLQTNWA
jgi:hypothetical protein